MNNYLPERPIEPPTEKPDYVCDKCEAWLYGDEAVYESDGLYLCEECFREEIDGISTAELADMLGVKCHTAEGLNDD